VPPAHRAIGRRAARSYLVTRKPTHGVDLGRDYWGGLVEAVPDERFADLERSISRR
jgi:hypothetical protein